jgi:hypothetical protein
VNQRFGGGALNQFQGQFQGNNFGQFNQGQVNQPFGQQIDYADSGVQQDPTDFVPADQAGGYLAEAASPTMESPVKGKVC